MFSSIEPKKWQKWMLMETIGLTPQGFRNSEVRRYAPSEINRVVDYISNELSASAQPHSEQGSLFIVKVIDATLFGQFPNIRFRTRDDLRGALEKIRSQIMAGTVEVWICKTTIDYSPISFAGRYLVQLEPLRHEIIELVWWDSPRILNSISHEDFDVPYLVAERFSGQMAYRINQFRPGKKYALELSDSVECVRIVCEHLRRYSNAVSDFESLVERCGLSAYNLEFKFAKGRGVTIDWDTASDGRLLESYAKS